MVTRSDDKKEISSNQLLNGLADQELFEVYTIGKIEKHNTGDYLFKQGGAERKLFLLTKGSIKITLNVKGQERDISIFQKGEGFGNIGFDKDFMENASAVVLEPSNVMILDNLSMDMLAPRIQIKIYRNLNNAASKKIAELIYKESDLQAINSHFSFKIKDFLYKKNKEYVQLEIIQNILKNIPRLPVHTTKLLMLLLGENVSIQEVVNETKLDPSLVGFILKIVNSAYHSFRNKISDIQHAILLLGFNQVYQIVVDDGVKSIMPNTPEIRELQRHSQVVSFIATEIAKLCNVKIVTMSTIALLHDIGKIVILLIKKEHQKLTALTDLLDYASTGSQLLKEWGIPDIVHKCVEYQCFPEFFPPSEIPEEYRKNTAILYVAHLCFEALTGKEGEKLSTFFLKEYLELLNIAEKSFTDLFEKQIMPVLFKQIKNYPEDIGQYLTDCKDKMIRNKHKNILE